MHWKIERDPFLSRVASSLGEQAAWDAGFFLDTDPTDAPLDDVDWRCTPPPRRRPSAHGRPAVLLATGGFCPVHDGHLAMMTAAKAAAERAGFDVLGGYLSPGHDEYLRLKCGDAAIPSSVRLRQCAAAAATTDWLSVDPWEALHRRVAVNFTDVTARLRAYLRMHVDPRIEVLYVCGGDNARFGLAFAFDGGCIVVSRPGAETETSAWRERLAGNPRVLWTEGDHPGASRALRSGAWVDDSMRRLVVRLEGVRAVRTLGLACGDFVPRRSSELQSAVLACLAEHATVRTETLKDPGPERGVISLDPMLPSTHELAVSRLFALGGYHQLGHRARPGTAPLDEQVRALATGSYVLRDDDCMTGGTLAAVRALLEGHVEITGTEVAVRRAPDEEIVDSRDFVLGADDGGLVVELPDGMIGRAPYVLPYVDPAVRCSIPFARVLSFSSRIWELNAQAFEGTRLCVRDLPAPTRCTFEWLGEDRPLEDVCRWHVERLAELAPPSAR